MAKKETLESKNQGYAVIETGGKQYRVSPNNIIKTELIDAEVGDSIELDRVLAASDGTKLTVGSPVIKGAKVKATVVEHTRAKKVVSFKKKKRKGYSRKVGHRQHLSVLKIEAIS